MSSANWRHFDFWLLGAVAILTIFGVAMINSTIAGNIDVANNAQRQLTFAVIGFAFVFLVAAIDYHLWASISSPMYWVTFAILVVLNVFAAAVFGSARWFETALVNIQPSELAKIVLILTVSAYFARNLKNLGQFRVAFRSLLMAMGLITWVLIQPNMSTSILMVVIWFALWWASGMHLKHLMVFAGIGIALVLIAIPLFPVLQDAKVINDYQIRRIQNFLAPEEGSTYGETYNIDQAEISIGSGGLLGQGYGQGPQVQLRFLKVRWSDFIFAALAHEFGFVGSLVMMGLQLFVVYRCLRAARKSADTFGGLICYGVATLLAFQAMVNIGVNLKLMPATGLPLPFISYGGSSLLSLLLGIGLVESVMLRHKSLEFHSLP